MSSSVAQADNDTIIIGSEGILSVGSSPGHVPGPTSPCVGEGGDGGQGDDNAGEEVSTAPPAVATTIPIMDVDKEEEEGRVGVFLTDSCCSLAVDGSQSPSTPSLNALQIPSSSTTTTTTNENRTMVSRSSSSTNSSQESGDASISNRSTPGYGAGVVVVMDI